VVLRLAGAENELTFSESHRDESKWFLKNRLG